MEVLSGVMTRFCNTSACDNTTKDMSAQSVTSLSDDVLSASIENQRKVFPTLNV